MCLAYLFEHVGFCENKNVFYLVLKKAVFRGFVLLAKHDIQFAFAYIPMSMAQRAVFHGTWNEIGTKVELARNPCKHWLRALFLYPLFYCSNIYTIYVNNKKEGIDKICIL